MKILHIGKCDAEFGGVEKLMYDIYLNIDHNKFVFDFLSPYESTYTLYEKELKSLNSKLLTLGTTRDGIINKIKYNHRLYKFLKKNKYDVVHINSGSFFFVLMASFVCKIAKSKKIVIHSHSNPNPNIIKRIAIFMLKPFISINGDYFLACSKDAAKALYTNRLIKKGKVRIIHNGIEVNKFKFNQKQRDKIRKELKLEGKIVYSHVGRFAEEKNHEFLIDVFNNIQELQNNAVLVLIGDGPLDKQIRCKINDYNLSERIILLGKIKNVYDYLNAFDCFILPSFYEGLGIVNIEAQASGLPLIVSDVVPKEVKITNLVDFISLQQDAKYWASEIIKHQKNNENNDRSNYYKEIINNGYDIEKVSKEIEEIYLDKTK